MPIVEQQLIVTSAWAIELACDHRVARFAAGELQRTLRRIGAPTLAIVTEARGPRIALRCGNGGDGFVRAPDARGLTLRGDGPRGLLYAVYDLLEALGCRWVAPGPTGERLPRLQQIVLPGASIAQRPALPGRCLVMGHDFMLAEAEQWIIWAARNRLNTLFVHTIARRLSLGACRLSFWRRRRAALLPLLDERGMELELGGHAMSDLLPRRLFRTNPQLFRFDGERRTPRYNFCPSSPEALAILRRNAATFFRAYPEAQLYHLWADDLLGGGWCRCEQCAPLTPADQALIANNTLAGALAAANPDARLAHLAYHDTQIAPAHIHPHPAVVLLYAPRPRSYARSIADPASSLNQPFWKDLQDNLALFAENGEAFAGVQDRQWTMDGISPTVHRPSSTVYKSRVFEYYLDGILFKSAIPPLAELLREDLRAYAGAGVHMVQALMTGDRPWLAAPLNAYLFARLAWEPEQEPGVLIEEYAAARAPRTPQALARAYAHLAVAWRPVLDIRPGESAPPERQPPLLLRPLAALIDRLGLPTSPLDLGRPPADQLDYMEAPVTLRERRLEALAAAAPALAAGRAAWAEVLAGAFSDQAHLAAEHAEWELAARLIEFIVARQQLYVLEARKASPTALRAALVAARAALDTLLAWGDQQLPPGRPRANFQLLRMLFRMHLDALEDRCLASPWRRFTLRMALYRRLARLTLTIIRT